MCQSGDKFINNTTTKKKLLDLGERISNVLGEIDTREVIDTLFDNEIRGQPMRDGHNKVYKSFSDVIEGKEGSQYRMCLTL